MKDIKDLKKIETTNVDVYEDGITLVFRLMYNGVEYIYTTLNKNG